MPIVGMSRAVPLSIRDQLRQSLSTALLFLSCLVGRPHRVRRVDVPRAHKSRQGEKRRDLPAKEAGHGLSDQPPQLHRQARANLCDHEGHVNLPD